MLKHVHPCWSLGPAKLTEVVQVRLLIVHAESVAAVHEKAILVKQAGRSLPQRPARTPVQRGESLLLHDRPDVERKAARQSGCELVQLREAREQHGRDQSMSTRLEQCVAVRELLQAARQAQCSSGGETTNSGTWRAHNSGSASPGRWSVSSQSPKLSGRVTVGSDQSEFLPAPTRASF